VDAIEREVVRHHQYVQSVTPLAHPPARRRQAALLWLVSQERGFIVGRRDCPPLTADMRVLIAKGHLRLQRRPSIYVSRAEKRLGIGRFNLITATSSGEATLTKMSVPDTDRIYIVRAFHTGVLQ
jgi:hypothetical protein